VVVPLDGPDATIDAPSKEAGPPPDVTEIDAACNQIPLPDGGPVTITGSVIESLSDGGVGKGIPDAMVAAEYGVLYGCWSDLSKGSPYYVFGAMTDSQGKFTMKAREGVLGFHSFATGYNYTRSKIDDGGTTTVLAMEANTKPERKPVTSGAKFDKTVVAPGAPLTFSVNAKSGVGPQDPLSDELILVEPTESWAIELDPPSAGLKDNFPDGVWTKTFPAPTKVGTYTYYFSATAAYCETSAVETFTVKVQ
jgi:hypothetical protein